MSSCYVGFKSQLDTYLGNIVDHQCGRPGFNNSLDGGDCLHGGQLDVVKQSKHGIRQPSTTNNHKCETKLTNASTITDRLL